VEQGHDVEAHQVEVRNRRWGIVVGSAGGEYFESRLYKNGAFTFALLEALRRTAAMSPAQQDVRARSSRYLRARVETLTQRTQRPATRGENLDLDFPIFYSVEIGSETRNTVP
jgi:hypothetical protein